MAIMPACGPILYFLLGRGSSDALIRGIYSLGTKCNSFLVGVRLGLTLTTVSAEENIAAEYSLGLASREAIMLSSGEPTSPNPCTCAFIPVRKDLESIAPRAA